MTSRPHQTGLLLTHLFVRPGQEYKFQMLKHVIDFYKNIDNNFFIAISGHGQMLPEDIQSQVDGIYWEQQIDERQIGRGHAKFCIEGFKILKNNKIDNCIKARYCDVVQNISLITKAISENKLMFTEQTCLANRMLGDLLMSGNTEVLHDLWSMRDWDYSKSGLYNLYDNLESYARKINLSPKKYLECNCVFHKPEDLLWLTIEHIWSQSESALVEPLCDKHLWGRKLNYEYYGGF